MNKHAKQAQDRWIVKALTVPVRGAEDLTKAVVEAVSSTLASALQSTGKAGDAFIRSVTTLATSAVKGAGEVGAELGCVAKGFLIGTLRGTRQTGDEAMRTMGDAAGVFMRQAARAGADVVRVAVGLVEGAILLAEELGIDAVEAASVVAQSIVDAGYDVGAGIGDKVTKSLSGTVKGVKIVLKEPFRAHRH